MNYSLLRQNLVAFYAKLNKISEIEFHFALEVSFSIFCDITKSIFMISQNRRFIVKRYLIFCDITKSMF